MTRRPRDLEGTRARAERVQDAVVGPLEGGHDEVAGALIGEPHAGCAAVSVAPGSSVFGSR
jgi:hypothetical protein